MDDVIVQEKHFVDVPVLGKVSETHNKNVSSAAPLAAAISAGEEADSAYIST
jgi:hypothetical protein